MFANTNWMAVFAATIVAFLIGGAFYGAVGKRWMRAARIDPATPMKMTPVLIATTLVMEFVMSLLTAGTFFHLNLPEQSLRAGLIAGFLLWLGFILPTMTINHRYQDYGWDLTFIDGLHWLLVMLGIGATIALLG